MPTPYEQELLEMSRRANAVKASAEPQTRELDLRALFSPQTFEITAAQLNTPPTELDLRALFSPQTFEITAAQLNSPSMDLVGRQGRRVQERIAAQQEEAVVAQLSAPQPSLESILMASAAREIGMDQIDAMAFATASADFGIDYGYDMDADLERAVPNEAVRFQVGRESPPHRPFSANREMGPQDGVVVGQRVGGRFEPVRQARQSHVYDVRTVQSPAPIVSVDTSPAPVMSALDVVSGDSFDNI